MLRLNVKVTFTLTNVISVNVTVKKWSKMTQKCIKSGQKGPKNGQKHKKLFFSAPERARTVLNAFLECLYLAI